MAMLQTLHAETIEYVETVLDSFMKGPVTKTNTVVIVMATTVTMPRIYSTKNIISNKKEDFFTVRKIFPISYKVQNGLRPNKLSMPKRQLLT